MNSKSSFSENMKEAWKTISLRGKILLCVQSVLTLVILIIAVLGLFHILPIGLVNRADLILLAALFAVSAVRSFPQQKTTFLTYVICAAFVIVLLIIGFY